MAAITRDHGINDIYVDGAFLKVGQDGTMKKKPDGAVGSGNPLTKQYNQSGKMTFDIASLPWKDTPTVVSSGENAGTNKYLRATAVDKALKLKKDAHSDNFYISG